MINLKKFYKNKKVLITGHTGFKGSWLVSILNFFGAKIYGVSLNVKKKSHFNQLKLKSINNKFFNITNYRKLNNYIKSVNPDVVFHLAAQSLVKKSFRDPIFTWNTNVIGTLNLLESLKSLKKKCSIVIITSDKCYLNIEKKKGYVETDRLGGHDPYSGSKAAAEGVFFSEFSSFFKYNKKIKVASARAGNVVGGGDWSEDRIIPDFFKSIIKKKKLLIRSPKAVRPWQHVLEPLFGYLVLGYKLSCNSKLNGCSFNFGPNGLSKHTVLEVLNHLKNKNFNIKWVIKKTTDKETKTLILNSKLALKKLGWKTKLTFNETMALTADWYYQYILKKKIITFEQINDYMKKY